MKTIRNLAFLMILGLFWTNGQQPVRADGCDAYTLYYEPWRLEQVTRFSCDEPGEWNQGCDQAWYSCWSACLAYNPPSFSFSCDLDISGDCVAYCCCDGAIIR